MACNATHENFDDHSLKIILYRLVSELGVRLKLDYEQILDASYNALLTESLHQVIETLIQEPYTHKSVLETEQALLLVKEPLKQMRFKVSDSVQDTKKVLEVFALHELFNTITKLVDTLHLFSHVEDQINLDDLEFRDAIQRYLNEMFTRDDKQT